MKIATFRAKCKKATCRHDFDAPLLSDFRYGEFIFGSIDGKEIRYYCGFDSAAWDFIDKTVSDHFDKKSREEIGVKIQNIIGLVADRHNQGVYFTQDIYCPKCQSKVKSIDDNNSTGLKDYDDLTFNSFTILTELGKKELIYRHLNKFE